MKLLQLVRILAVLGGGGELLEAQMPPVVLRIDSANFVRYDQETADWTKYATVPGVVTLAPGHLPPFGSYTSLADAKRAVASIQKNVKKMKVEYSLDKGKQHRWELKATNGRVMARAVKGYKTQEEAEKAVKSFTAGATKAAVVEKK